MSLALANHCNQDFCIEVQKRIIISYLESLNEEGILKKKKGTKSNSGDEREKKSRNLHVMKQPPSKNGGRGGGREGGYVGYYEMPFAILAV